MIRFRLAAADLATLRDVRGRSAQDVANGGWRLGPEGWSLGSSFIHPFDHRCLSASLLRSAQATAVIVVERASGDIGAPRERDCSAEELAGALAAADTHPLDCVTLAISHHDASVTLKAGAWGTAPVYLVPATGVLLGDWDPTALFRYLPQRSVDPILAVALLTASGIPYSSRTLFPGLLLLTERAEARWQAGPGAGIEVTYPAPATRVRTRAIKDGADVPAAFVGLLRKVTRRWIGSDRPAFCELSGGLDSAIVSAVARSLTDRVHTFGLEFEGEMGGAQAERRRALSDRFGFVDHAIRAFDHPPFADRDAADRFDRPLPWQEFYVEAVDTMLTQVVEHGGDMVLTGSGGDELCLPKWDELSEEEQTVERCGRADDRRLADFVNAGVRQRYEEQLFKGLEQAPPAWLATSSLEAALATAPLYLRYGVWPVSPLSAPEMVQFCSSLPNEWRAERRIERETLARWGLPPCVTHPGVKESFSPFMTFALRGPARRLLEALFAEPILSDLGIFDAERLAAGYQAYCRGERDDDLSFYAAAMLELTVRSVSGEQAPQL